MFGTLTVDEVIESGGTALAVAAEPVLGRAGYWLMTVTALFATSGATNAGLYPAAGLCEEMAAKRQFPPELGRRLGGRAPAGIVLTAAIAIVLAVGFDLSSIASIGSAIALCVFTLVTVGASAGAAARPERAPAILVLGVASTVTVLVTFAFTTLVDEPATAVTLVAILVLSIVIDLLWKRTRDRREHDERAQRGVAERGRSRDALTRRACSQARSAACPQSARTPRVGSLAVDATADHRCPRPRPSEEEQMVRLSMFARRSSLRTLVRCTAVTVGLAVVAAGCGSDDSSSDSSSVVSSPDSVAAAEARVATAQTDLDTANGPLTSAGEQLCSDATDYVTALDRYGKLFTDSKATVGDVKTGGADLVAPKESVTLAASAVDRGTERRGERRAGAG